MVREALAALLRDDADRLGPMYVDRVRTRDRSSGRTRPVVAQFGAPACSDGWDACLRISPDDRFAETRWRLGSWTLRPEKNPLPQGANALVPC